MKTALILLLALSAVFSFAGAQEAPPAAKTAPRTAESINNDYRGVFKATGTILYPLPIGQFGSTSTDAGEAPLNQTCADVYNDFYSGPVVNFNITLGYADSPGRVDDSQAYTVWLARLMRDCPPHSGGTCGFKKEKTDDGEVLGKDIVSPDGQTHHIRLSFKQSSASIDDLANRTTLKRQQEFQSQEAHDNLRQGFEGGAALVMYIGHGRTCTGPSTEPPILAADGISINYGAYRSRKKKKLSSEDEMLSALHASSQPPKTPPKLVGYYACDDEKCEEMDRIRQVTGNRTGVVGSVGLTDPFVAYSQAYATLDSLLLKRCKPEFMKGIQTITGFAGGHPSQPAQMLGFLNVPEKPPTPVHDEAPMVPTTYRPDVGLSDAPLIHPVGDPAPEKDPKKKIQKAGAAK